MNDTKEPRFLNYGDGFRAGRNCEKGEIVRRLHEKYGTHGIIVCPVSKMEDWILHDTDK